MAYMSVKITVRQGQMNVHFLKGKNLPKWMIR